MTKYIIKNCPAIPSEIKATYGWCNTEQMKCQDCTDCLLKRIVERCKSLRNNFDYDRGANYTANEILSMFRIEECE